MVYPLHSRCEIITRTHTSQSTLHPLRCSFFPVTSTGTAALILGCLMRDYSKPEMAFFQILANLGGSLGPLGPAPPHPMSLGFPSWNFFLDRDLPFYSPPVPWEFVFPFFHSCFFHQSEESITPALPLSSS